MRNNTLRVLERFFNRRCIACGRYLKRHAGDRLICITCLTINEITDEDADTERRRRAAVDGRRGGA